MSNRENETAKRPRRSLLSFASQPEPQHKLEAEPERVTTTLRDEDNLDHYHRMRALRLAAGSEFPQPPLDETPGELNHEAAEQNAINRMRADMAAIKAELNRRFDAAERDKAFVEEPSPPVEEPASAEPEPSRDRVGSPAATPLSEPGPEPVASPAEPVIAPVPVRHSPPGKVETRPAVYQNDEWRPLVDPRIVINRIGRSKALILATTIIGTLLGVGYAMTLPKLYSSTVEVLVDPRDLKIVDKEIASSQLPVDASLAIAESQLRVIQSSSVLTKVIDRAGLANDPEFNGDLKDRGIVASIQDLFSTDSTPDPTARETLLLRNLYDHLEVERSTKNFIFNITVKSRDPQKSALIANTVSDVFREEQGNIQSDTARQATESLTARLTDLRAGVQDAENAVQRFKAENDLVDVQGRLISDDEITRTNDELTQARNQTIRLKAQADSIRNASVEGVLGNTLPEEFRSGVIVALRSQYGALKQQADGLATKLGPRHPQLIQAQSQASGVRSEIRNELSRIASSVQVELRRSMQQEQDLSARLAQLKARTASNNEDMIKLRELEREVTAKREVYEAFLLRAKETGELEGMNTTNIRVISPARPALESTGGSRKLVAIGGLVCGLLAGLAIAILLGMIESFRAGNRAAAYVDDDAPVDPVPPSGGRRVVSPENATPSSAVPSESRLGAAIRRAQTRAMTTGPSPDPAVEEAAIAERPHKHADAHLEPRHHDNSNVEEMLAEIAKLREVLNRRAG
ncbi:GumC family protein [Phyllobacterium endophyticum]|uniref:GumC family protein n=1 Tax=Phyllobacterium endophyticum TaxID=1149773 RepID=UPI0011C7A7AC|nr:GumC family protein [Phyllobacterium endophyticum]TXR48610.1 chain-length determining protein [Phyllobacterium endophyticum]